MQSVTERMEAVCIHEDSIHQDRLVIPKEGQLTEFEPRFPSVTHLIVERPLSVPELEQLLKKTKAIKVLDVRMQWALEFRLKPKWFSSCQKLRELALRFPPSVARSRVLPLVSATASEVWPPICSLTLSDAKLLKGVMKSFVFLDSLQKLSLEGCDIDGERDEIRSLTEHSKLHELDMTAVHVQYHRTLLKEELLKLNKKVIPHPVGLFRTDFNGVLTANKSGRYCFTLEELHNRGWNLDELKRMRTVVGADETAHWEVVPETPVLTHNRCDLMQASPFHCPDGRERIAAIEPEGESDWQYVHKEKVPLIVMVKEASQKKYYPAELGEKKTFGTIQITCTDLIDHILFTERTFTLSTNGEDHKLHHIQINWPDGYGLEVDTLSALIDHILKIERTYPDTKSIYHCMLGLGRTGTILACLIVKHLVENTKDFTGLVLDLEELLRLFRQRRSSVIQHEDQLVTILEFTLEMIKKRNQIT